MSGQETAEAGADPTVERVMVTRATIEARRSLGTLGLDVATLTAGEAAKEKSRKASTWSM